MFVVFLSASLAMKPVVSVSVPRQANWGSTLVRRAMSPPDHAAWSHGLLAVP